MERRGEKMHKKLIALVVGVAMAFLYLAPAQAADFKLNGVFKTWSISQNDFRMGKDDINDWYTVSLVRMKPTISAFNGDVVVHLRMDLAQGWWGVDNQRGSMKNFSEGARTHAGENGLFTNKETNYAIHVDEAWIDLKLPFMDAYVPTRMHLGRFYHKLGNKLILDYELDGVRLVSKWNDTTSTVLTYSIMNEGYMGLSDNTASQTKWDGLDEGGSNSGGAARVVTLQLHQKLPNKMGKVEAYFLGYHDSGTDDGTAYLRDDIDYSIAHYAPQIGSLTAWGIAGDLKLDNNNISIKFEGAGLWGKDPINNQTYHSSGIPDGAGSTVQSGANTGGGTGSQGYTRQHYWNRLDVNDGDINGWTFYLNSKLHYLESDYKVTPGLVVGAGSGDSDPTQGSGNVTKLQTEGWFYICEVWEDSIMPDLTGITPQGLGSPWSRGYREFENQILVQVNNTWKPLPKWSVFLSATYVHAMEDIYAWDDEPQNSNTRGAGSAANGGNPNNNVIDATSAVGGPDDMTRKSKDIGFELDWKIDYTIFPKLVMTTRGGYFWAGDGAAYLIAGAKGWNRDVYELRWDLTYKF